MDNSIAIIFGIVQGATEFIPVSSSGHLVLLHELFPSFATIDDLAFDVALHVGTLLAVISFFWKDVVKYLSALFRIKPEGQQKTDRRLSVLMILAIIPAGLAGLLLEDIIELYLRSPIIVAAALIAVAVLFLIVEAVDKQKFTKHFEQLNWKSALFIGCMQILSVVFPGTSRSGITIVAGMMAKLTREQAARFSFLLSIPLILAAGLKKMTDLAIVGVQLDQIPVLLLGSISSAIVGYLAIGVLLRFLKKNTLKPFAYYRIVLGALVLLIVSLN